MQFDTLRAFPYPVLRPDVDDYLDSDIQVTVEFCPSEEGQKVTANVSFHLSVDDLKQEVTQGRARYVVVFACRDTYYRHVCSEPTEQFTFSFPTGSLRGEVVAYPYILAVKAIAGYSSKYINPEFGPGPFNYDVGSVLALDRPQAIYIDRDVFKPLASVFVLTQDDSLVGHIWQVKPTDEKVQIRLSPELKQVVDVARNNKSHRAVLMNSIYFGAVMHCITQLKHEEADVGEHRWAKVILQRCHNEGIDLAEHDEYLVAQRLMKSPFQLLEAYVFKGGDT
jgi:hypothetical protein